MQMPFGRQVEGTVRQRPAGNQLDQIRRAKLRNLGQKMTNLLSDLMAAGFTEYEAKVYLALLHESPATGYQLSKQAGIPRSMVYESLGRLHARGAVLKTDDHRATLYRPVPPDALMDRYEQEHQRLIQTLRDRLRTLYKAQDEDRLWSIRGRSSVLSYAAQMIQGAQEEILFVLADLDLLALKAEIEAACRREVKVSALLTGQETLDIGQVARHPPLESELQELTGMLLIVVDGRECLIAGDDAQMPEEATSSATITNNRNLILIARQFVWMELFAQRIYNRLGNDLLERLAPSDRQIFENFPLTNFSSKSK
jgi:Cd2+/Zn2+-exporting ATPase